MIVAEGQADMQRVSVNTFFFKIHMTSKMMHTSNKELVEIMFSSIWMVLIPIRYEAQKAQTALDKEKA